MMHPLSKARVSHSNTAECWVEDITREIMRRLDLAGDELRHRLTRSSTGISVPTGN
jgi:hypothetical protein